MQNPTLPTYETGDPVTVTDPLIPEFLTIVAAISDGKVYVFYDDGDPQFMISGVTKDKRGLDSDHEYLVCTPDQVHSTQVELSHAWSKLKEIADFENANLSLYSDPMNGCPEDFSNPYDREIRQLRYEYEMLADELTPENRTWIEGLFRNYYHTQVSPE